MLSSKPSRLEDSSKSISHLISSCQYFLKSFFHFFVLTFLLGFLLFAESSIIISFCTRKVKSFWASLQSFRTTFPGVFEVLQGGVVWGVFGHKMWVLSVEKPPSAEDGFLLVFAVAQNLSDQAATRVIFSVVILLPNASLITQ